MACIPSAGLWGRRVIFAECPLVVRAERVWLCLPRLSLLRWCRPGPATCGFCILCCGVLCFLVLSCFLFALYCWCIACFLVEGWVDLMPFVCGVCVGCFGGGVGVAYVSHMKSSFVLACFLGACLVCSICQGCCESLSCFPLWFSAPLWRCL